MLLEQPYATLSRREPGRYTPCRASACQSVDSDWAGRRLRLATAAHYAGSFTFTCHSIFHKVRTRNTRSHHLKFGHTNRRVVGHTARQDGEAQKSSLLMKRCLYICHTQGCGSRCAVHLGFPGINSARTGSRERLSFLPTSLPRTVQRVAHFLRERPLAA